MPMNPMPIDHDSHEGETGVIRVQNSDNKRTFHLDGVNGDLWVGGSGASGDILLFPPGATNIFDTKQASVWIGGTEGAISIRDASGQEHMNLNGQGADIWLGGNGQSGDVLLFKSGEADTRNPGKASIWLQGEQGDIVLQNADCAEEFDIAADAAEVEPGTVMVMDDDGKLRPSEEAFDRRVAGVISGAGDYKPGIVLDRQYSVGWRLPIALVGKVFCKVDADHGAIQVGDLLTTSPTPGHAMKAGDPLKAFGAVLGKALRPLQSGQGLIPVLVALQ